MARQIWGFLLITLAGVLCGCTAGNSFEPSSTPMALDNSGPVDLSATTEVDLVEKVATSRQKYEQALELLVNYYARTGNNARLGQAQKELTGLKSMPHYAYIPEAYAPDASLKATMSIPAADAMFADAEQMRKEATKLGPLLTNKNMLRLALDKYMQLITHYQNSDKIDDAAFEIAEIHRQFKDYRTALLYYQRAYEWDPNTPHPARFQAARLLDDYLSRREDALQLYQQAIKLEGTRYPQWKAHAEERIAALTNTAPEK